MFHHHMKHYWLVFGFLTILTRCVPAADIGVVTKKTPLKSEPSIAAEALRELRPGAKLQVVRRKGLWFEVKVMEDATPGWVRFSRVRVTESLATEQETRSSGNLLTSLSRSATGLFGYGNRNRQSSSQDSIATIGIRGLNASDLKAARPDEQQVEQLNAYRSSPDAAQFFARVAALSPQQVDYLEENGGFSFSLPSSSETSSSLTNQRD